MFEKLFIIITFYVFLSMCYNKQLSIRSIIIFLATIIFLEAIIIGILLLQQVDVFFFFFFKCQFFLFFFFNIQWKIVRKIYKIEFCKENEKEFFARKKARKNLKIFKILVIKIDRSSKWYLWNSNKSYAISTRNTWCWK